MRRRRTTSANSTAPPCHPAGRRCPGRPIHGTWPPGPLREQLDRAGRCCRAVRPCDAGHRHGVPRLSVVPKLQLLPAVDVADGQAVRLVQGEAGSETSYGDPLAVGLDVRGTRLAARGWTREGGELYETLARLDAEGCARYVVTDITKDGTLRGPNLDLLREVCAATPRPVVASGGVSSLDDIRALAALTAVGVEGAIVGKALYAGAFTLPEALRVTEEAP